MTNYMNKPRFQIEVSDEKIQEINEVSVMNFSNVANVMNLVRFLNEEFFEQNERSECSEFFECSKRNECSEIFECSEVIRYVRFLIQQM